MPPIFSPPLFCESTANYFTTPSISNAFQTGKLAVGSYLFYTGNQMFSFKQREYSCESALSSLVGAVSMIGGYWIARNALTKIGSEILKGEKDLRMLALDKSVLITQAELLILVRRNNNTSTTQVQELKKQLPLFQKERLSQASITKFSNLYDSAKHS